MDQNHDYNSLKPKRRFSYIGMGLLSMMICLSAQIAMANPEANSAEVEFETIQSTVTGTVTDVTGAPLPGANVLVKGTTNGTQTDFDGNYTITAASDATLVISYIGFASQEVAINGQSSINVSLAEDASQLDEVILTGYTSQSTRDITGSVSVVDTEALAATAPTSVEQALQGQTSGVTVGSQGGPGGKAVVRIRGFGTINGNDPLYIIDGTPTTGGLNDLNPNDIESIQILKDASSAAIYGFRAANGVIIVTTKKGRGKVKFDANVFTGVDYVPNSVFPDLATPQQLLEGGFQSDQYVGGQLPVYLNPSGAQTADESAYSLENNRITRANQAGTQWFDEYFNSAQIQNYNFSASGGTENANFFMSLGALNQEGVGLETGFKRYTLRANSNFNVTDRFRIGENITISYSDQILPPGNSVNAGTIASLYRIHPLIPLRDVGGNFAGSGVGGLGNANNPLALAERNKDNDVIQIRALGGFYGEYDILKNLTFKSNLGFDLLSFNQRDFSLPAFEGETVITATNLREDNRLQRTYTWFNTLNYNANITKNIQLEVLAGTEFNNSNIRSVNVTGNDFPNTDLNLRVLDNATGDPIAGGFDAVSSYFSIFGKADVKINDKYLLSGTLRRDASSKFTEDNRTGVFPSGSFGWRVSKEDFLVDSNTVSDLLFKVGYGVVGNDGGIPVTARATTIGPNIGNLNYPTSNGSSATGFGIIARGNPDLTWETTTTLNIGISSRLFENFTFDFDWYDATTEDMLLSVARDPSFLGNVNTQFFNIGEMNNTGFDATLGYANTKTEGDFNYGINLNVSAYKNEVVFLDKDNDASFVEGDQLRNHIPNRTQAGQPLGSFFGKVYEGLDSNGNVVFANGGERQFIGNPHPDFTYGLNFTADYKDLDFSLLLQGSQGNDIYNFMRWFTDFNSFPGAKSVDYVNANGVPGVNNEQPGDSDASTYFIEDGSYLRLKNIVLGYSIPETTVNKLGLSKVRFYLQGKNLLTLTDYTGLDPEINLRNFDNAPGANLTIGTDSGTYPINRSVILGLNVSF